MSCAYRFEKGAFVSQSAQATSALGRALAEQLAEGDIVFLMGELGAGKTQLTKGIAQALQATDEVTSPTFALHLIHPCAGAVDTLHHFDLYRLEDELQLEDIGLFDVLGEDGVCIVEWGEKFPGLMSSFPEALFVSLAYGDAADERIITIDERSKRKAQLDQALASSCVGDTAGSCGASAHADDAAEATEAEA